MVVFSEAEIESCIVHGAGNQAREEELYLSEEPLALDDSLTDALHRFFFKPFKAEQHFYKFTHETGSPDENELFAAAKKVFDDPAAFQEVSKLAARRLYECSEDRPQIKSGECCVVLFDNLIVEGEPVQGLGIFKVERKNTFLEVNRGENRLIFDPREGINVNKCDKSCIIFNTEEDSGFRLLLSDQNQYDAKYWPEQFLNAAPDTNESYFTDKTFEAVNSFASEMVEHNDASPAKMEMLDRTAKYFDDKESFNMDNFVEEVIQTDSYKEKFKDYKKNFDEENKIPEMDEFQIDRNTAKKSKKKLNNTIKLDGQIQIKLNFDNENQVDHYLEKGYDAQKEMHFYKVYFREED